MVRIKYKTLNKNYEFISEDELLDILLKNRGVENPKELLNVNETHVYDGMLLENMKRGLSMLEWHVNNNSKIHILADVDIDGLTSATMVYNYIRKIHPEIEITYSMNEDKRHGIILKNLEEFDFELLIVPDAGTNDTKYCKMLSEERDVDILILDHHTIERENNHAIVINCQDGKYPNTTLSGAGVVYKFIKEYDKKYGCHFADDDLDLVAVGMVADSMDLRNYETRHLCNKGLKRINNSFVSEILEKHKVEKPNFMTVGWKIAPPINAVTRVGTAEERLDLIGAFIGKDETREYQPRRKSKNDPKPPVEIQTLQKAMVRETTNIKARQDRAVTKGMEALKAKIEEESLTSDKVIVVDGSDMIEKSFTGLVANKLAEIYKRPVIILKKMKEVDDKIIFGGSGRNYRLFPVQSLMDLLKEVGTFDMVSGHSNAFGIQLSSDRVVETRNRLNEKLKDVNIEDVYLVDYEIPVGRLKEKHVLQVGQWADIWGNTLKKPLFCISGVSLKTEEIQLLGEKRNFIKFDKVIGKNKITFVKTFASEDIYNKMTLKGHKGLSNSKSSKVKMDIIGEFELNEWNGNVFPQVNIVDFNCSAEKEFRF